MKLNRDTFVFIEIILSIKQIKKQLTYPSIERGIQC